MILAAALLLAILQPAGGQVPLFENGFCTGISWITLRPGEVVTRDDGPDFTVFQVRGPGDAWWGVYAGNAAQVSGMDAHAFAQRDGVTITSRTDRDGFRGYLARDSRGWQNHFFGSVFHNASGDLAFFDRVDFSAAGQAKCRAHER
jgi:hypothetical protein